MYIFLTSKNFSSDLIIHNFHSMINVAKEGEVRDLEQEEEEEERRRKRAHGDGRVGGKRKFRLPKRERERGRERVSIRMA